jgi:hypothetical protein
VKAFTKLVGLGKSGGRDRIDQALHRFSPVS